MKKLRPHQHLYPIINIMVESTVEAIEADDKTISCQKGCDHCCHLLVEISWEEARELAYWLVEQPKATQKQVLKNIKENVDAADTVFNRRKNWTRYNKANPSDTPDYPDALCDHYFYKENIPCPFLKEGGCQAYVARPTVCRFHMVTSPATLCQRTVRDNDDYEVPDEIDTLSEEVAPIHRDLCEKDRWGHLGTMVATVLKEEFSITV